MTHERLSRYLAATERDISRALELYEYNIELSEALYGILHGLEVTLRNAEHLALTISYGTPGWYDVVPSPLSPYWRDQLQKAKAKPGAFGKPGKIVAELTFGFWVDLLQAANHGTLWIGKKLSTAFPNARRHRKLIHERLKAIQLLRNRLSHQEPILTAANALYTGDGIITIDEIIECVEWICTDTALWMRTSYRYANAARILAQVAGMNITL